MKKPSINASILLIVALLTGCSNYNKIVKSNDNQAKYEAAVQYYEQGSHSRAGQLLEDLSLHYRGRDLAENICWYYANNLMKLSEYYMAEYQFRIFTRKYPYSPNIEDAYFLMAYCCYLESPAHYLDQGMTKTAIQEFETFASRYPSSPRIPEVNHYLDILQHKLEQKDYEIALGYYNTESYHAASVALHAFLNEYPESSYREDAMFYALSAGYLYAANSREDKVKERMVLVINDFDKFSTAFATSKHLKSAQDIYTKAKATIARIDAAKSNTSNK